MSLNKKMGDAHEEHLVEVYGGRRTRGSGNQPANPMDGRRNRFECDVAFAWDGKSSRGNSIGVSRDMLAKAKEQAHGERPMIALRWYDDDRLRHFEDWAVVREDDLLELIERSERLAQVGEIMERLADGTSIQDIFPNEPLYDGEMHAMVMGLVKAMVGA